MFKKWKEIEFKLKPSPGRRRNDQENKLSYFMAKIFSICSWFDESSRDNEPPWRKPARTSDTDEISNVKRHESRELRADWEKGYSLQDVQRLRNQLPTIRLRRLAKCHHVRTPLGHLRHPASKENQNNDEQWSPYTPTISSLGMETYLAGVFTLFSTGANETWM